MRIAVVLCVVMVVACSGPIASRTASGARTAISSTSLSPHLPLTVGGIVEHAVPDPATFPPDCQVHCPASLGSITRGPDGNIWFVDMARKLVGRITPEGDVVQFAAPVQPTGGARTIAAGPDGNIWFTASGGGQGQPDWIVRVTPSGAMTKFAAGSGGNTAPEGITAGPDGNMWFTEVFGSRIGRITPSGNVTEFPLGGAFAPRGITAGRDGALWFTGQSFVGRITTEGVVTGSYEVGTDPSLPLGDIVQGPDGNMWFTGSNGLRHFSAVGGASTSPVILPSDSRPGALLAGPDDNIWFTDTGLNAIVRVTVSGAIRQFPMPRRNGYPTGMALGSDGRVWFTETGGRIASIGATVPEGQLSARAVLFQDSATKSVTISSTGDVSLSIKDVHIVGPDAGAFSIAGEGCGGRSMSPGAKCTIGVSHAASGAVGVQAATLEVVDNATGSPHHISLVAQLRGCKLPVTLLSRDGAPKGEMLDTATGQFIAQPAGIYETVGPASGIRTSTQPVLNGQAAGYYDQPFARWLPVYSADLISPDGSQYAYETGIPNSMSSHLHVVDVATGRDRELPLPDGPLAIVAFTRQGIYMHFAYEGIGPGLVLVDPATGSTQQVLPDKTVLAVSGSTAWIGERNAADTLPPPPSEGGLYNQIVSRDLATGATTNWFYGPGTGDGVAAVINGLPVVSVYDGVGVKFFFLSLPNQAQQIEPPFTDDPSPSFGGFVPDREGFWVASLDGIYLWTSRTGAILVSDVTAAVPAGTCA